MRIGNSQSIFFLSTPAYLCAAFKDSLQLEPEVTLTASENLGLFSFSENLHCLGRGFTRRETTELNWTNNITKDPLLICLARGLTQKRFSFLSLFIVESLMKHGVAASQALNFAKKGLILRFFKTFVHIKLTTYDMLSSEFLGYCQVDFVNFG